MFKCSEWNCPTRGHRVTFRTDRPRRRRRRRRRRSSRWHGSWNCRHPSRNPHSWLRRESWSISPLLPVSVCNIYETINKPNNSDSRAPKEMKPNLA